MKHFDAAGIAVYALSYDEADALKDFRDAHGITYTLLSDPESDVIRSFAILNTLIDPTDHPWYGIPYPGTYVVNAKGTVTHKFFDNNLAVRVGPEQLLLAAQGEATFESVVEETSEDAVAVSVMLDGDSLASVVQKDLVVHFNVPAGRHVYAEPAPQGSVAVDVILDENNLLVQRPLVRPMSESHTLQARVSRFRCITASSSCGCHSRSTVRLVVIREKSSFPVRCVGNPVMTKSAIFRPVSVLSSRCPWRNHPRSP